MHSPTFRVALVAIICTLLIQTGIDAYRRNNQKQTTIEIPAEWAQSAFRKGTNEFISSEGVKMTLIVSEDVEADTTFLGKDNKSPNPF